MASGNGNGNGNGNCSSKKESLRFRRRLLTRESGREGERAPEYQSCSRPPSAKASYQELWSKKPQSHHRHTIQTTPMVFYELSYGSFRWVTKGITLFDCALQQQCGDQIGGVRVPVRYEGLPFLLPPGWGLFASLIWQESSRYFFSFFFFSFSFLSVTAPLIYSIRRGGYKAMGFFLRVGGNCIGTYSTGSISQTPFA